MTIRDDIRAELAALDLSPFTEEDRVQILMGYRNYYASEWLRKRTYGLPFGVERQEAMVLTWAIRKLSPGIDDMGEGDE